MGRNGELRKRWVVIGWAAVSVAILGLTAGPSWALGPGQPPSIKFAAVWVDTNGSNPAHLVAQVEVEVPGGIVPVNIQTVSVAVPGGGTFTMPFERRDLGPAIGYLVDLTSAGVVGFPAGTYTFSVTDTSSGVSTATDTLASTTGLAAPASISISGVLAVPPDAGPVNLLNIVATPSPTVSWAAVTGAAVYRVLVRESFGQFSIFSRYTSSGSITSMVLPAGIMVPGRRYIVRVEAFDVSTAFSCSPTPCTSAELNARGRLQIEVVTEGLELFLTFPTGKYSAGQTLTVTTRINNPGPTVSVDARAWIGLPTGQVIPVLEVEELTIPSSLTGDFYNGSIGFSYTFTGSEPPGIYVVGLRFIDPATGETVALASRTFAK